MRTDRLVSPFRSRSPLALAAAALALAWPRAGLAIEVVQVVEGADGAPWEVVVYTSPPALPTAREKLDGADLRTYPFAEAPQPSGIPTLAWDPGAPSQIPVYDWRSGYGGIPIPGTGNALVTQSWNPDGPRYEPSRIRTHFWPAEQVD